MIFRRIQYIKELPENCTVCSLYPFNCSLPLENEYLKDGLDVRRDELCSLIEIMESDIDFFLDHAKKNRESSQALSELPEQIWKELHKSEVLKMDAIIARFENIKRAFRVNELFS
jgi:hypothetical protein